MSGHGTPRMADVVFDAPASVSIYLHALVQAGRHGEAAAIVHAHEVAAREASVLLADTAGWSTVQEAGAQAPHHHEPTVLKVDLVLHGLPQHVALHSHVITVGGSDVDELRRHLPPARSRYGRCLGDALVSELGLRLAAAPAALELDGVPSNLVESFEPAPCKLRAGVAQVRQLLESSF